MKSVSLIEAKSNLEQLFDEVQSGSPVLVVRGDQVVRLDRVEPPEFGGDMVAIENMLREAVQGPNSEWIPVDLDDMEECVREQPKK